MNHGLFAGRTLSFRSMLRPNMDRAALPGAKIERLYRRHFRRVSSASDTPFFIARSLRNAKDGAHGK